MASIVVHHLGQSRSLRLLWLLEELGLDYTIQAYERNPKTLRAPSELKAAHPLGKAPVLEIDGKTYAETGAVFDTVLDKFDEGALRPAPGTDAFDHYRFFLHYSEGSMMSPLLVALITHRLRTAPLPFFLKPVVGAIAKRVDAQFTDGELALHSAFVEEHLTANAYFAGEAFSAADIVMSYGIESGATRGMFGPSTPKATAWLEDVRARAAYQRAVERGGPSELRL